MGIYIKDMQMPKNCSECKFIRHGIEENWCYITSKGIPCECPLIEIPVPHGDLIDMKERLDFQYYDDMYEEFGVKTLTIENFLYSYCDDMPTIIVPKEDKNKKWESL